MFPVVLNRFVGCVASPLVFICVCVFATASANAQDVESVTGEKALEELQSVMQESRRFYLKEFEPLREEITNVTQPIHHKIAAENQLIAKLRSADDKTLQKVRDEIKSLVRRVELLERAESVLSDMDPGAIEKAIKVCEANSKELKEQVSARAKPLNAELSGLHREYQDRSTQLKEQMSAVFRPEGIQEAEVVKKHSNASFVMGTYHCQFVQKNDEKKGFTFGLEINSKQIPNNVTEKFDGKFPILNSSDRQLRIRVNDVLLKLSAVGPSSKKELAKAMRDLIDLDAVAQMKIED